MHGQPLPPTPSAAPEGSGSGVPVEREALLRMTGISKAYGTIQALDAVDFELRRR